ncbi:hypothetical protein [Klebsiella pneumoniae]|uniref:hypothetical protein n=1 Tax=Klebsiella pneumoniae TaxID=573 RepID=UPI0022B6B435|nr:hypothetical protein [Klebsiella pneumoniae]
MSAAMQSRLGVMRMVGRTWLTITMVSGLLFASLSGVLWYRELDGVVWPKSTGRTQRCRS